MIEYEYKTIPGPTLLEVKSEQEVTKAIESFGNLINSGAYGGWDFYTIENITVKTSPGCMGKDKERSVHYYMLVFRRPRPADKESVTAFNNGRRCPDEMCVGAINDNNKCNVCGRSSEN